jgi:hypothetical protein
MAGGAVLPASGTRRASRRGSRWAFVSVALPFAILAGIAVFAAVSPYESTKTPPPGTHGSLVWGDGIFANQIEMKAWLKLHGARYGPWAKLHPKALSLVKPRPKPHRAAIAVKKKKTTPKAHPVVVSAPVAIASQRKRGSTPWLFIVLGFVLAAGAIGTPKRALARAGVTSTGRDRELRLAVAGVGVAVLAGAAAAFFLG